tara:strand:+ start:349 stop:510 length:162 start_codon:yes stop_codon:yes gene_type:complete
MTVLDAILEEMDRLGLDNATGINICELIDRHNIEVEDPYQGLVNSWKENKNLN